LTLHLKTTFPEKDKICILVSPAVAMIGLYTKKLKKLGITEFWGLLKGTDKIKGKILTKKLWPNHGSYLLWKIFVKNKGISVKRN